MSDGHMLTPEQESFIAELWERRIQAYRDSPKDHRAPYKAQTEAIANSTTVEDTGHMRDIYNTFPEHVRVLIELFKDVEREYAKGLRCSVCGMTPEQSKAVGNDCIYDC